MLKYWLWLTMREKLSARVRRELLRHFETPEEIWLADHARLASLPELGDLSSLEDKDLRQAERVANQCYQKNIGILTWQDAAYPQRLRCIDDPPLVLYYSGTLPDFDAVPVISVVGTRKASGYGLMQAKSFGYQLSRMGALVISGGAAGIDTLALRGALSSDGITAAVLGCGVDVSYPVRNRSLFEDIRNHGCLISEYPPGTPAISWHFPERNRILSALSLGVLVIEAPKKSGALITANHALEQGKDVFAIPANLGQETCAGNIQLLKDGAIPVEEAWDVVREYQYLYPNCIVRRSHPIPMGLTPEEQEQQTPDDAREVASEIALPQKCDTKDIDKTDPTPYIDLSEIELTPDEYRVAMALQKDPLHVDEIVEATQIPAGRVLSALTTLELKGIVNRLPARRFSLAAK